MVRNFVLCIFILVLSMPAVCQILQSEATDSGLGGSNVISGSVLTPTGQRIGLRIRIKLSTVTRGDRVSMTDDNGYFAFKGLPAGSYTIVIDGEKEYEPLAQNVDVIQFRGSPPQVYNLSLRLSSRRNTEARPGIVNVDFADVPKNAREIYDGALELAKSGDHAGAIEKLKLAVEAFPGFMMAYNELGVQYLHLNKLDMAVDAFETALKIRPEAFPPLMNEGIALVQLKRFADAKPMLQAAIKVNGSQPVAHYFLGQALANLGKFDEAEKELTTALTLGGDAMAQSFKEAHRVLAIIYSVQGDKKRQAAELESYLKLAPTTPDAEQLRKVLNKLKESDDPQKAAPAVPKPPE